MKYIFLILSLLLIPSFSGIVYAHTVDAVGEYRIEIGWMNEPVVSGDTNGLELYVSPLVDCPDISIPLECANSQKFQNGIEGLRKLLKIQFVYDKTQTITLPLVVDHNIPGKYYAFITPTVSGYFQANLVGKILETPVNLSMHPPPIAERSYIEFPESSDFALTEVITDNAKLVERITSLENSIQNLENSGNQMQNEIDVNDILGTAIGIIAVIIAIIALIKTRKN
ncbi:MAG: hypothetical protein HOG44_03230 [Nitrosopumilus sp.]|jgi:hypothetical protein|nr:hypothetical protein [Nitrosopumilus sp.]MBT3685999.1 hypothetical protein [Nitrosopumilus sp.]MBT3924288.1 hypothetical protein [Nitrosopumilus sp.]MBT4550610.1 hypothetical protein [Nitrosopumilus sp.]MBT7473183.1 hypothetical protein [Nitrosopumilus sp.]